MVNCLVVCLGIGFVWMCVMCYLLCLWIIMYVVKIMLGLVVRLVC